MPNQQNDSQQGEKTEDGEHKNSGENMLDPNSHSGVAGGSGMNLGQGFQQAPLNGMQSYMNNIKQTTQELAMQHQHMAMFTHPHMAHVPNMYPGAQNPH